MKKGIIIYSSKTGFTKRYAEYLAKELSISCIELKNARKDHLADKDFFVFGSWIHASSVMDLKKFHALRSDFSEVPYYVFVVGLAPVEATQIESIKEKNPSLKDRFICYCQGGLSYDKMGFINRLLIKAMLILLSKKKSPGEEKQAMMDMIKADFDGWRAEYLKPLLDKLS